MTPSETLTMMGLLAGGLAIAGMGLALLALVVKGR